MKIEVTTVPKEGETENGDAYFVRDMDDSTILAVIDGIGHGAEAHLASQAAVACLERYYDQDLTYTVRKCHEALHATRGAVLAITHITDDCIRFVGIGNITAMKIGMEESHFTSMNGIIGHNLKNVRIFSYPPLDGGIILMHSDGLRRFNIMDYDLSLDLRDIGEMILSDHRVDDDATILLAR